MPRARIKIGGRGSPLSRIQIAAVLDALGEDMRSACEVIYITTKGDREREKALKDFGGSGAFVSEVREKLLSGEIDAAVHSFKDVPTEPVKGLVTAAVLKREDPRDALVGAKLSEIKENGLVATGSPRRRVQLSLLRPDLRFVELRGNIETRLSKIPAGGAVVVALAALRRLGLEKQVAEVLEPFYMLPQAGQGAICVEVRAEDRDLIDAFSSVDDPSTRAATLSERACLSAFGAGCHAPFGALASVKEDRILLEAFAYANGVAARERVEGPVSEPEELGRLCAKKLAEALGVKIA